MAAVTLMPKDRLLEELAAEIRVCPQCRLCETRTHAVPGEGSATARIMFIGEGPGEKEDQAGRPFVGPAGQLLDKLLERAGIARSDVFITNIVKCRPPGNRVPLEDEIAACHDFLMAQIAIIEPKIICPLGNPSLRTLLSPQLKISSSRCKVFRRNGILFIPLYHPAAALHQGSLMDTLQRDIGVLKELINRPIREDEITDLPSFYPMVAEVARPTEPLEPQPSTLSLF